MPKLEGKEVQFRNNLSVDKENAQVWYNDSLHKYYDKKDNSVYISCTQLIHEYVPKYDENWWSQYKALERLVGTEFAKYKSRLLQTHRITNDILSNLNVSEDDLKKEQSNILKEWERKRNESCERGTKIHAEWENKFYDNKNEPTKQFGVGGKIPCYKGEWELSNHGIFPEFLLSISSSDGFLKCSGQADLIICNNGEITVVDHKTNAKIEKNGFFNSKTKKTDCLKFPLNHIPNSSFWIYTLQMSLYAYSIETKYPEFKIKKLILNHIYHDGVQTLHECQYLKTEVIRMLNHYKKTQKIKQQLEKDKPINLC